MAEERLEYRYEDYLEEDGRIYIRTHAVGFEKELTPHVTTKGFLIYDGISGATPTGEAPTTGSDVVPLAHISDIRRAGSMDFSVRYGGRHTSTPSLAYSEEGDYISKGVALTHSMEFNQKNTTLSLGAAHNFDRVKGGPVRTFQVKDTTDVLFGFNQVLTPTTVFTANLTLGFSDGYLADPYRSASFILPDSPDPIFSDPFQTIPRFEVRPRERFKQVLFLSATQAIKALHASVEGDYRFYHDDWGILAHTVSLTWFQKLTKYLTVSPSVRYYRQSAADFYGAHFRGLSFNQYANGTQVAFLDGFFYAFADDPAFPAPGDPAFVIIDVPARPAAFSSDYRLSEFQAWTFGITAQIHLLDHLTLEAGFKRYEMRGLDGVTVQTMYPSANVFSVGCGWSF
jgi:Protein of unknown function (DUF3570)